MPKRAPPSPASTPGPPDHEAQVRFWDGWNAQHRLGAVEPYMARQAETALKWARTMAPLPHRILEVGCGTGWLSHELAQIGAVTGVDLSPQAIAEARRRFPGIAFITGDFLQMRFPENFDLVVSADVVSHVADQRSFVQRVGEVLRPGGLLVLMSQNAFVWNRTSYLKPPAPGQIRNWPSLLQLRQLLRADFDILDVTSIVPGGDQGLLWLLHNRASRRLTRMLLDERRVDTLYEKCLLGRELVMVARRNGPGDWRPRRVLPADAEKPL